MKASTVANAALAELGYANPSGPSGYYGTTPPDLLLRALNLGQMAEGKEPYESIAVAIADAVAWFDDRGRPKAAARWRKYAKDHGVVLP